MKLAHVADPHLGYRSGHRNGPGGINQRELDVALAFTRVVDDVIACGPDCVLLAGDLFHSIRPTNAATLHAYRQLRRLREALPEAPVVLIAGNHDTPNSSDVGSPLRILGEIGIHIATSQGADFYFRELDLLVRAVPHAALLAPERPPFTAHGDARYQVLTLHGEAEGTFAPTDELEYGGAFLPKAALLDGGWDYVALGHYHVTHGIGPACWYAGAPEHVSSNIWGELEDQAARGLTGKGWLLVDLDAHTIERRTVELARQVLDLEPIQGAGLTPAELDHAIANRAAAQPIDGQIVRLRVYDVDIATKRQLDHAALRQLQARALSFQLDVRKPETIVLAGRRELRRKPLTTVVAEHLAAYELSPGVDRAAFLRAGAELMDATEREAVA